MQELFNHPLQSIPVPYRAGKFADFLPNANDFPPKLVCAEANGRNYPVDNGRHIAAKNRERLNLFRNKIIPYPGHLLRSLSILQFKPFQHVVLRTGGFQDTFIKNYLCDRYLLNTFLGELLQQSIKRLAVTDRFDSA